MRLARLARTPLNLGVVKPSKKAVAEKAHALAAALPLEHRNSPAVQVMITQCAELVATAELISKELARAGIVDAATGEPNPLLKSLAQITAASTSLMRALRIVPQADARVVQRAAFAESEARGYAPLEVAGSAPGEPGAVIDWAARLAARREGAA